MERVSQSRRYEVAGRGSEAQPTNVLFWNSLFEGLGRSGNFLQLQIRRMIVAAIEEGRLPLGARMPSSRDLAGILKVSRNTIVIAYEQLVDQNFLVSRERSGYFVAGLPKQIRSAPDEKPVTTDNPRLNHFFEESRGECSSQPPAHRADARLPRSACCRWRAPPAARRYARLAARTAL